jgi:predicted DNA-binding helix-hairpin-helix protein
VFCVNGASSSVQRAHFPVQEVVRVTRDFYRRNYIEGLSWSSGIIKSSDQTRKDMVRMSRELSITHDFKGNIHPETIPNAVQELVRETGLYANRFSINKMPLCKTSPPKKM